MHLSHSTYSGFSVGDELGLGESLGNTDSNKRRSISQVDQLIAANAVGTVPASKSSVSDKRSIMKRNVIEMGILLLIRKSDVANVAHCHHLSVCNISYIAFSYE